MPTARPGSQEAGFQPMGGVRVDFEHCYGIGALKHEFSCSDGRAYLVYAPNGSMKTSFAKAFLDKANGKNPQDIVHPELETRCEIEDCNGDTVPAERIMVVEPLQESYTSERISTLMVDKELQERYQALVEAIEDRAAAAVKLLGKMAGYVRNPEIPLLEAFGANADTTYDVLVQLHRAMQDTPDPGLAHLEYRRIFDPKVVNFLGTPAARKHLAEYVERYNELVDNSSYFRRGVFDHYGAISVVGALTKHGFFEARHTVSLVDRDSNPTDQVTTKAQFDEVIEREKSAILGDAELSKRFHALDDAFNKNDQLRGFRTYLEVRPELIAELDDLPALAKKLWLSYAFEDSEPLIEFTATYERARMQIREITRAAAEQRTEWEQAVEVFHARFEVPFTLEVKNQHDVILKNDVPTLVFHWGRDGDQEITRGTLNTVLSQGERRALYLLNVIFDLEARKKECDDTILVLDDIADSFDYRNKYAIVEYLNDLLQSNRFTMFVLTHNFDFFRTVWSRLDVHRRNCLMVEKDDASAFKLVDASYLYQPFKRWRADLTSNRRVLMAVIPLMRNLIEYARGSDDPSYVFLTSLLHVKPETGRITLDDLAQVISGTLAVEAPPGQEKVIDVMEEEALLCVAGNGTPLDLESKVLLAMAIRLRAERYMLEGLPPEKSAPAIGPKQTARLFRVYRDERPDDLTGIALIERVLLMTPESIHLNSFMYEPILDMSDHHLRSLYSDLDGSPA